MKSTLVLFVIASSATPTRSLNDAYLQEAESKKWTDHDIAYTFHDMHEQDTTNLIENAQDPFEYLNEQNLLTHLEQYQKAQDEFDEHCSFLQIFSSKCQELNKVLQNTSEELMKTIGYVPNVPVIQMKSIKKAVKKQQNKQ